MTPERLIFLQAQFDRYHSNFLGYSMQHSQCSSFDVPDSESLSREWVPSIRFERHTLYKRDENGLPVGARAWVAEGVIIRAWRDDFKNVVEIIGQPLSEITEPGRGHRGRRDAA